MVELPPIVKEAPPEGSHRVLLTISYDGSAYSGWQLQNNAPSIQQKTEEALREVTGETIRITGASRTDAGVHALGQRCHFDTYTHIPSGRLPLAMNTHLPPDIRIIGGRDVPGSFHARFDARGKCYTYRIHNSPYASALYRNLYAHIPQKLNFARMEEALPSLLGKHDFAAFQASGGTAKTTVRTIRGIHLQKTGEDIVLTVEGDAFLYNMVRIIAGTLCHIGTGRLKPDAFTAALSSKSRLDLGYTAPACGLELTKVLYSDIE